MAIKPNALIIQLTLFISTTFCLQLEYPMTACINQTRCYCNKNMTIVDCSDVGLTSIPDLPVTAVTVDLAHNNITTIPSRAFSELERLEILFLSDNNITTIQTQAFWGLGKLKGLELSQNNIRTIPTRAFWGLKKLEYLFLYSSNIQSVQPFAFDGLESLTTLQMWENHIPIIGSKNFANIPQLNDLDLHFNSILHIAPDAFTGTSCVSSLELGHNKLTEVPSIGPQLCLSTLDLSGNSIVNATFPVSYRNNYTNLSVQLSDNKIETLDRFTFSSLAGTTIINMYLNANIYLTSVGQGTFDVFASIERLNLIDTDLSIEAMKNIADSCRRTKVTYLELTSSFPTEEKLLMSWLSVFMDLGIPLGMYPSKMESRKMYVNFEKMTNLGLSKYDLLQFSNNNFTGKKNILAMDLSLNEFSSFPQYLPLSLESLNLDKNHIHTLQRHELSDLGNLKSLTLSRNGMQSLFQGIFDGLEKLQILDLTGNKIMNFMLHPGVFTPLQNLTHLFLGQNSLDSIPKLYKPLVSLHVLDMSENGLKWGNTPFCESFPSLQKLNLEDNNLGIYSITSERGDRLFKNLSALEEISIVGNNIQSLPEMIFHDQTSLKTLNISKNQISGWGHELFKFTKNLDILDLSYNSIPDLTENNLHYLNHLQELYLRENPFVCNCDLLWFREWIDRTSVTLPDIDSCRCHGPEEWRGKPLLEFTKDKINCTAIPTIVGAVAGAIFITVVSVMLVYRNRWRLRLRLYLLSKRGKNFLQDVRGNVQHPNYGAINDDVRGDRYDAYISCSENDYDWVLHHLLPDIDNDNYDGNMFGGEFKLYYDPRDQDPGTMAIANIFEHMSRSRKVIVVLTTDYLKDGRNIFELDQATTLYHDQELDDIIVIKVGDVPANRVPAHLYTQMRTGRFLEWEQDVHAIEQFKEKLKDRLRGNRVDLC